MFASDFQRLTAAGTYGFPTALIEAEQPQVVIQLFVDRVLRVVPATNPPELLK